MIDAELRPAAAADGAFLRRMLYEALYVADGAEPFPRSVVDEPPLSHYVEGFGDRARDVGLVATIDGEPVGACWCRRFRSVEPGYGWVADDVPELTIALVPTARGRGVGSRLLHGVLDALAANGERGVSLSVDPASPARRLYEREGFRHVGWEGTSMTMLRDLP